MSNTVRSYQTLREANIARQEEWDVSNQVTFSWRANELAGEAGEVCNILKKLHREACGLPGSRATNDELAEELADVLICVDLCAMTARVEIAHSERVHANIAFDNLVEAGNGLASRVGAVSGESFIGKINHKRLHTLLALVIITVNQIALMRKIDIPIAVANKFNATSAKMGFRTRLRHSPD